MGNSTFIEINNDMVDEIEKDKTGFIETLLMYLYTGDKSIYIPAVTNKRTIHRDFKDCTKLKKLLKETT